MISISKVFLLTALVCVLAAAKKKEPVAAGDQRAFEVDAQGQVGEKPPASVGLNGESESVHSKVAAASSADSDMKAHMAPKAGEMAGGMAAAPKVEDDKLIRAHVEEAESAAKAEMVDTRAKAPEGPSAAAAAATSPAAEEVVQWRNLNMFWMATVAVCMALLLTMVLTAVYFKRQAESLKHKAIPAGESCDESEADTDDASSYDQNNPKVMVNKQLLDRMTSISMKLKASVLKARSESSASQSTCKDAPQGEIRMED